MRKKFLIIIVVCLILFLLAGLVGYFYNINNKTSDFEKSLIKDGYTLVDLDKLESSLNLVGNIREFNIDENNNSLKTITTNGEELIYEDAKVKLENGKVTFTFKNNKEEVPISNVTKVYIEHIDCLNYTPIYLLTEEGILYGLDQKNGNDKLGDYQMDASEFSRYNENIMYNNILEWKVRDKKCGYAYDLVGVSKENETCLILTGNKFNYIDIFNYLYIKNDRSIEYPGLEDKKYKYLLGYLEDEDEYIFLTTDNYLYTTKEYTLVNNSPVKKIYQNNSKYVVIFSNDETKEYAF